MRGVVVQDQMDVQVPGRLSMDGAQELEELLVAMAGQALANHLAVQGIERGEQRGSPLALVLSIQSGASAPVLCQEDAVT